MRVFGRKFKKFHSALTALSFRLRLAKRKGQCYEICDFRLFPVSVPFCYFEFYFDAEAEFSLTFVTGVSNIGEKLIAGVIDRY